MVAWLLPAIYESVVVLNFSMLEIFRRGSNPQLRERNLIFIPQETIAQRLSCRAGEAIRHGCHSKVRWGRFSHLSKQGATLSASV